MLSWIKNNQNWWKKNSWYFAVSLLPCHSARNRSRRLRIHVRVINHSAPGEGGRRRRWVSVGKIIFHHLLSTLKGSFSTERSLSFAYWNNGFCNSGQALRAEWQEGGVWVEDESSSIKCAATNFKNELTLFFLKDINQLKPTYIASIQIQSTHQSITNRKSFIPKPILRASFQKQLALDQSKTDAHSINSINLHVIRFPFDWFS